MWILRWESFLGRGTGGGGCALLREQRGGQHGCRVVGKGEGREMRVEVRRGALCRVLEPPVRTFH